MVRKSMGSFIAALRKANGMTQMDLADRLNVSDKTVSRWERGEGAPDLSLIPIIADIFQVTSDELLRGERRSIANGNQENDEKRDERSRKQVKRLLIISLSKFRNQNIISMGIMSAGLIGAMICNFGFNRGYLGFFTGFLFYVIGILSEIIFINMAFSRVSDDGFQGGEINSYKISILSLGKKVIILGVTLFAITLPLILTEYSYFGLWGKSWLKVGILYGVLTLGLCTVLNHLLDYILVQKKVYILEGKEKDLYISNFNLKKRYGLILVGLFFVTLIGHWFLNAEIDPMELGQGASLGDLFGIKTGLEEGIVDGEGNTTEYFDGHGKPITEKEAMQGLQKDRNSGVLYTYVRRNDPVTLISYVDKHGFFPITVYAYMGVFTGLGKSILAVPNYWYFLLYLIETLAIMILFYREKAKVN